MRSKGKGCKNQGLHVHALPPIFQPQPQVVFPATDFETKQGILQPIFGHLEGDLRGFLTNKSQTSQEEGQTNPTFSH